MKRFFPLLALIVLSVGCVSTNKTLWDKKPVASVDPFVSRWLEAPSKQSGEVLPVLVVTRAPMADMVFLKKVGHNRYTGHVTKEQLRRLMQDERVLRISGGQQKLHGMKAHRPHHLH